MQGCRVAKQQPATGRGEIKWDRNCVWSCGATAALPHACPPASNELWVWISGEGLAVSVSCTRSSSGLLQEAAAGMNPKEYCLWHLVVMDNAARAGAGCCKFSTQPAPRTEKHGVKPDLPHSHICARDAPSLVSHTTQRRFFSFTPFCARSGASVSFPSKALVSIL